ncbi:hypothetical protein TWF694_002556 [Orbilia ellipsospora]|uniref:SnoaL-like domain-containing protein n=1 Tax=Orbilia ellipsospora TaxID=2528407 RepID=A0AAV9X2C8_9PEZI
MASSSLTQTYKNYIQAINDRDWQLLRSLIHPQVIWNSKTYTAKEYIGLITRASDPAPDLKFHIDMLVADEAEQRIAARLLIRGTPVKEFLGYKPNGKAVDIVEHVFYEFKEGKIWEVKTVIDMDGVERQLGSSSG